MAAIKFQIASWQMQQKGKWSGSLMGSLLSYETSLRRDSVRMGLIRRSHKEDYFNLIKSIINPTEIL